MKKTIAEKILGAHAGKEVAAGEIVVCGVDFCFAQDGTSGLVIDSFRELGDGSLFDKERFTMVLDHSAPSPNKGVSEIHKKIRGFAKEKGVEIYDIGCGVCHQVVPESGRVSCGDLVLGADSHTCTYGALNLLSTGVGSTDLAITLATGKNWFRVPETIKIILGGRLPAGVYAKDVILYLAGQLTADGATYKSIEFEGEVVEKLSMDARFTICNMAVEVGAKFGVMRADKKTFQWLKQHSANVPHPVEPDGDANYCDIKEFDVSLLEPQISLPDAVDNTASIEEVEGTHIDEAFLGTCTNGRMEDLEIAAKILKGKRVCRDLRFIVAPASKKIFLQAMEKGLIKVFVEAGAAMVTPGCGPCVGTHNGVPSSGETVISSANRNFKGRMGNPEASIYLASPATVAVSALAGKIADPRKIGRSAGL